MAKLPAARPPTIYVFEDIRQLDRICGIYAIVNIASDHKAYVGSSINIYGRLKSHIGDLRKKKHHCCYLQRAWDKHGEDSFRFGLIEEVPSIYLKKVEQLWIDLLPCLYNTSQDATHPGRVPQSAETKAKRVASLKGIVRTPEWRANIGAGNKGKTRSLELRARISASLAGRKLSDAHKAAMEEGLRPVRASSEYRAHISESSRRMWADPVKKTQICAAISVGLFRHYAKKRGEAK